MLFSVFFRHIYRDKPRNYITKTDSKALKIAEYFFFSSSSSSEYNPPENFLTIPELIFALMPLRHSPSHSRLSFILDKIKIISENYSNIDILIQNFEDRQLEDCKDYHQRERVITNRKIRFFGFFLCFFVL